MHPAAKKFDWDNKQSFSFLQLLLTFSINIASLFSARVSDINVLTC